MINCKSLDSTGKCIQCKSDYTLNDQGNCVYDTPLAIKIIMWFIFVVICIAVVGGGIAIMTERK